MGNGVTKLTPCFPAGWRRRRRRDSAAVTSEPFEEGLGHSFCYLRPDPKQLLDHSSDHEPTTTTTFRSISGAALSANTATPLSTSLLLLDDCPSAAAFDCSTSFTSIPLQPIPPLSGPLDRAFLSGPLERSFLSGPLDPSLSLFSGPLQKPPPLLRRSLSHGGAALYRRAKALSQALSRSISIKGLKPSDGSDQMAGEAAADEPDSFKDSPHKNLQWAQGKAGEDRVHVVVSEDRGWLFVGIYDGFNGPDATDYLLSNLYPAVQTELKGLLWDETSESRHLFVEKKHRSSKKRWKCEWDKERSDLGRTLKEQLQRSSSRGRAKVNHSEVLKALAMALKRTEEAFLDVADKMVSENPELALMGSCVLAMLMRGEDVYLMNVGDSRAVLGHKAEKQELGRINEESLHDLEAFDEGDEMELVPTLSALQLTLDHSTCIEEEVRRIRSEHPEDAGAIMNDRVKGSLKVTRAFGAGFLKQPKWNNVLLEMFRIDYVGASPYITCNPFLYHHRLGPKDRFLILSSDGLYQYFTNEEAVTQVELFIATTPEGDPAQHLVEEVLFRAAKKAGMDFHELLEIPHGDRRRYHDDISIIVISFEGRIWRSCM